MNEWPRLMARPREGGKMAESCPLFQTYRSLNCTVCIRRMSTGLAGLNNSGRKPFR